MCDLYRITLYKKQFQCLPEIVSDGRWTFQFTASVFLLLFQYFKKLKTKISKNPLDQSINQVDEILLKFVGKSLLNVVFFILDIRNLCLKPNVLNVLFFRNIRFFYHIQTFTIHKFDTDAHDQIIITCMRNSFSVFRVAGGSFMCVF